MSLLFSPFARFWRKKSNQPFKDDKNGIVTVQMVMFSVLLFGGVGLMMDFGRAYSAHSQMQGYIDQVALAAAQQLDGKSDSITRATAAAQAVTKGSRFTTGDGSFSLRSLTFLKAAPTDANGAFSRSLVSTHNTSVSELATHVLAQATTSSVTVKLLNFASDGNGISDVNIEASAVATARKVSCGGLSPMVMCNPFEYKTDTSWQQEMENGIGYRMKLTADDILSGKPSNATVSTNGGTTSTDRSRIRLGLLKSPETLMDVRNTICSTASNLPNGTASTMSSERRKDICMLATVDAGLSCVNDMVAYKSAHPETITTGLDVIFDMYDDDMVNILEPADDFNFTHTFPASKGFPAQISRASLFYPDLVPAHGRMARQEFDKVLDNEQYAVENDTYVQNPNMNAGQNAMAERRFNFLKNARLSLIAKRRAAYGSDPNIDASSRVNHPFKTGQRTEWGPAPVRTCLNVENCDTQQGSSYPTIYPSEPGLNDVEVYARSQYGPYLLQQAHADNPGAYPNWWNAGGSADVTALVGGRTTYYSFYSEVERVNTDLHAESATDGHDGNDGTGAWITVDPMTDLDGDGRLEFDDDDIHYGTAGRQSTAINYPAVYGAIPVTSEERRVQRVTVVNCEAAQSFATATGDQSSDYSDTYVGEVVDVIDVFMITAPEVAACGTEPTDDTDNNHLCENSDITEVHLDVELVDAASINSVNFDARFYAVLVH